MKALGLTAAKNALANLVRGGASAMAALALPHFLARALDHDHFAAWALMLQIAAYASYLDFGLQTAVARYLAQAIELGDDVRRDRLVSTALGLLSASGMLAFCVLGLVAWRLHYFLSAVPTSALSDLRAGLIVLVAFAAAALPMSVFTGVLVGLHRNEYPALAIGSSRILGALAVVASVHYTHSLAWLAFCIGVFNLLGGVAQIFIARNLLPSMRVSLFCFHREMMRELVGYCSTLAAWSVGMLLIGGLDVTIVGYFNFSAVGSYSIAATLISFFLGVNGSVMSALMTPVAVLQARQEYGRIRRLITSATQLGSYASIVLTIASFFFGADLLRLWVGPVYAAQGLPILQILLAAQSVRLMGGPFSTVLVAMGHQRYSLLAGIAEAVTNLVLSVLGMAFLGAVGVAWATLAAAILGMCLQIVFVVPRVLEIALDRWQFTFRGIVQPFLALLAPMVWIAVRGWYGKHFQPSSMGHLLPLSLSLLIAAWPTWAGVRRALSD